MTIAAFILGGALAWLHFEVWGPTIAPGLRVWVAWMGLVTLALIWQAWRARNDAAKVAGIILLASYVAANFTWAFSLSPLLTHSARNIAVAVLLFLIAYRCARVSFAAAGFIYLAVVAVAALTEAKIIFNWPRPATFLAWSYPDIAAGLQHAALLVISFGIRKREGADLELHPRSGDRRGALGLARVAVHPKREDGA